MYENIWLNISEIYSNSVKVFTKNEVFFMKSLGVGFFMAEIDFDTNSEDITEIVIDIPKLKYNFSRSELTSFATKNGDCASLINLTLFPEKLVINSYPFVRNSHYELNIQMMVRILTPVELAIQGFQV